FDGKSRSAHDIADRARRLVAFSLSQGDVLAGARSQEFRHLVEAGMRRLGKRATVVPRAGAIVAVWPVDRGKT
ncbi:hypothetical protein, partial [Acinetobacter baumannii]|uniref:hypothetical protein n=1 Tax=Acinetobacter baumannii TaxID=470 RepID=UPI0013D87F0E